MLLRRAVPHGRAAPRWSSPQIYPENVWPDEAPPYFQEGLLRSGRSLHEAGLKLLRGAARGAGPAETAFAELCQRGPHVTRALQYLPLTAAQVNTGIVWGEEHTDFNLLTLLPGGRFLDPRARPRRRARRPERPVPAHPRRRRRTPRGSMVRGTRARRAASWRRWASSWRSSPAAPSSPRPHVITAPGVPGWQRQSAAHFMHVHTSTVLFPLPKFRTPEAVRNYAPPVLAGTYDIKTLVDIGLAPAERAGPAGLPPLRPAQRQRAQR